MQAIVVTEFGSADQLVLKTLADPEAKAGEVIIEVEAAGVGLVDVLQRQGYMGGSAGGYVPGVEVAGRVLAVGPGVDDGLRGKRVFAQGQGGYAQRFVAKGSGLVPLPDGLAAEEAVALGVNALVAHFSIWRARLEAGERVLVRGASGGIGAMVAQLAVRRGAVVSAVTNAAMADRVKAIGVQQVLVRGVDPEPSGPFDVIIDAVAGDGVPALIGTLAPNGRYVVNGAAAGFPPEHIGQTLLQNFSKSPSYSLLSLDSVPLADRVATAEALFAAVVRGDLRAEVAQILPLHDAAEAHRMLERGSVFGKLVLKP